MNNWCICWFSRILLLGILIFKGLTARRLYKAFGVKGLMFDEDDVLWCSMSGVSNNRLLFPII
jgi:hypothetical protein